MEITYQGGDFVLRISADQMLALRYALGQGVDRLQSDALFFAHPPRHIEVPPEHARSAKETYERGQAVRDEIEALMHRAGMWPKVEWPHDGPACAPAGETCLCLR